MKTHLQCKQNSVSTGNGISTGMLQGSPRQGAPTKPHVGIGRVTALFIVPLAALVLGGSGCAKPETSTSIPVTSPAPVESAVVPMEESGRHKERLDPTKPLPEAIHLVFGVYQTDKATELYRKFLPVIEAVQGDLSERLDRGIDIELRIFGTYEEGMSALVSSEVDFVRFGPTPYVLAKGENPAIELLAKESKKGKSTFKGVICVKTDSPYQTLEDLRGCRFAFGNQDSTIGRYLAQAELLKSGIKASDLGSFEYLAQHDMVGKAVILGDFDAGSLKESTFKKLNGDATLRKLHTFDNITKPWVASSVLHPELKAALRATLIDLSDPTALQSLKVTGFLMAVDDDYQSVRSAMVRVLAEFGPRSGKASPIAKPR